MTTTFTPSLRLWEGQPGDPAIRNAWGTALNQNQVLLESAILGTAIVNIAGLSNYTLTTANGAADQARPYVQSYTGALTANCTVTLPNVPKIGWAQNSTTGGFSVILTVGAGTTVTIPPDGRWYWFQCDGAANITLPSVGYGGMAVTGPLIGSGGITAGAQVLGATTTLTNNIFGQLIELQGSGSYTVTLPTPVGNPGGFRLLLAISSAFTLVTPAGGFFGASGNGTNTIVLSQAIADTYLFDSDGANWLVTALPNVNSAGQLTVESLVVAGGLPPGIQYGDMKHSALGIEGGGWRLCYGQTRPQTDPFWVYMVANGLTGSWLPGFTGSSTYNMPDARDVVLAGLDNMGGTSRGMITAAVANFDPTIMLNVGGNQSLQAHGHGINDPGHTHRDLGHGHGDSGHAHGVSDPTHAHGGAAFGQQFVMSTAGSGLYNGGAGGQAEATTGAAGTGIDIDIGFANITTGFANIAGASTGITVNSIGAGNSQNIQPTLMTAVLMYVGA